MGVDTFEDAFAQTERAAEAVLSSSATLVKVAKEMLKAAREGDINRVRKATERLATAASAVRQEVGNAQSSWPMTPDEEERALSDSYTNELIATAQRHGLTIRRQDERLVAFPSILRILPNRRAVQIDRKALSGIRPTRLVAQLKANAEKKPSSKPEQFIEVLYNAYRWVVGGDSEAGATLRQIYDVLTLMPELRKEYTPTDFSRDIFFLDRSGTTRTRAGATLSFPSATGTKDGKVFSFVAPDGSVETYYGIRFKS